MQYRLRHRTTYKYSQPVIASHHVSHMVPRHTDFQSSTEDRIFIDPEPGISVERRDYFGNMTRHFTVQQKHTKLVVEITSNVSVQPVPHLYPEQSVTWENARDSLPGDLTPLGLAAFQYAFASWHVTPSREMADYARVSFTHRRPILEAAMDLTARIFHEFTFDKKATEVSTPIQTVLQNKRGVCQDFAHLMIGCLRSLGLAARYVSGYIRTITPPGEVRLEGSDASHAWCSVYCPGLGWVDLDPTNNLVAGDQHVTLGWGRDFADVSPLRGVILGGGKHKVSVAVDLIPAEG
ncbi:MAG: transglutaminase family protein [Verrucomicrobiota bacterium]